ncbi:putative trehalase [Carex littledalei]|uniref:Trehalase n=1 Tax=Carex littledalei TaxID=544730 RepID=A0A833V801_9POAL|nr:putative trehalase [Carex littledalei]
MATDPLLSFLQRVQSNALRSMGPTNFDPKLYVDLPLKTDLPAAISAFNSLPRQSGTIPISEFNTFLTQFFEEAGSDLVYAKPVDFKPEPEGFLVEVENEVVRRWALEVHAIWKTLSRRVSDAVKIRPERHTLLYLPGTVIVPGSRFREVYYWDSYWVIRGLLASKMYDTAKAIVFNLVSLIESYGHVLNGARTYYINRSQPPLLSSMVMEIYTRTGDVELVKRVLPALLKEHSFWVSDIHQVTIQDQRGRKHCLSRYQARWYQPRPESATIDEELSLKLSTPSEKDSFYHEIASTAESGWDFSSRWMRNSSDLTTTATTLIIPVDLNTFIFKLERDISTFTKIIGDNSTSQKFIEVSKSRKAAIRSLLWNPNLGQWVDYWLDEHDAHQGVYSWNPGSQNCKNFASNFVPLWLLAHYKDQLTEEFDEELIINSLKKSGLICEYGIATSLSNTGQQWDFPNGWAPLQHMIIEGLASAHSKEARQLAESIAINWIKTNFVAYKKTGAIHEKCNVESCGEYGGGGEYKPQTGFGWTNGVILALLEEFGWPHKDRYRSKDRYIAINYQNSSVQKRTAIIYRLVPKEPATDATVPPSNQLSSFKYLIPFFLLPTSSMSPKHHSFRIFGNITREERVTGKKYVDILIFAFELEKEKKRNNKNNRRN